MTSYAVKLPDVGEGVAEAEVVEWRVAVGDTVTEDDVLADVMTDKATVELPSPVEGVVTSLGAEVGEVVAVGSVLVTIELAGGDAAAPAEPQPAEPAVQPEPAAAPESAPAVPDSPTVRENDTPSGRSGEELTKTDVPRARGRLAAPAVRERAKQLGVDLGDVEGSGPEGRVTHADLDARLLADRPPAPAGATDTRPPPAGRSGPAPADGEVEEVKIVGLRRNIAERMAASKRRIPHFTYVEEVDVTDLERLRTELNLSRTEEQPKLSLLPFLMRAVVLAVATHPEMNARFDDEAGVVHRHGAVHLGIAVQTARGLMVPVVADAGRLDVWQSAAEVARLAGAARTATISLEELNGSTITITSLGALGGIVSTPVINAPEVAIIGVNKLVQRPVYVDGHLLPRQLMNLSSSFDHRVVDGADAAEFIQHLKWLLETPALLFVDRG